MAGESDQDHRQGQRHSRDHDRDRRERARWAIRGTGSFLPEERVSSEDLSRAMGLDPSWIERRTGIRRRHVAAGWQAASDLAALAARRALEAGGLAPEDVGLI